MHRDVKPQNVLIGGEGSAKITDFGIARSLAEEGLTVAGRVLGTTDYVSPEQALGHPVTGQSDLYSLGVVLYEMLTGEIPFHADSAVAVAMRHVREAIPDVQLLRPEASAATAAVVERAVAKDLSQRYPDAQSMVSDLEEVLAIEAARAGQATGEATSVLRTLPGSARGRLPWRMRHPRRLAAALALLAAVVATALVIALIHTHRGTGVASNVRTESGLVPVPLGQTAAHDYNPFGTGPENHDRVQNVIDSEPGTAWSTESYYDGTLRKPGGLGTGVYLDAAPGVRARGIEIQTSTPGFAVQLYTSNSLNLSYPYGNASTLARRGWRGPIGASGYVHPHERIRFAGVSQRYRYYLLWLTSLPPGSMSASISELTLFK